MQTEKNWRVMPRWLFGLCFMTPRNTLSETMLEDVGSPKIALSLVGHHCEGSVSREFGRNASRNGLGRSHWRTFVVTGVFFFFFYNGAN